jgi:hypothetical protein
MDLQWTCMDLSLVPFLLSLQWTGTHPKYFNIPTTIASTIATTTTTTTTTTPNWRADWKVSSQAFSGSSSSSTCG